MTLVVCIAADCEQLQLRVLHQVILGVILVLGDQEEPRDLRHQQADQAGLQQQRHGCQESAAKLLHSGQYRGQRSVDIQFNRENNVKRIKIVWQSMKHVHYLRSSHNILAITKSSQSVIVIIL